MPSERAARLIAALTLSPGGAGSAASLTSACISSATLLNDMFCSEHRLCDIENEVPVRLMVMANTITRQENRNGHVVGSDVIRREIQSCELAEVVKCSGVIGTSGIFFGCECTEVNAAPFNTDASADATAGKVDPFVLGSAVVPLSYIPAVLKCTALPKVGSPAIQRVARHMIHIDVPFNAQQEAVKQDRPDRPGGPNTSACIWTAPSAGLPLEGQHKGGVGLINDGHEPSRQRNLNGHRKTP